jgi:hypothetical protein
MSVDQILLAAGINLGSGFVYDVIKMAISKTKDLIAVEKELSSSLNAEGVNNSDFVASQIIELLKANGELNFLLNGGTVLENPHVVVDTNNARIVTGLEINSPTKMTNGGSISVTSRGSADVVTGLVVNATYGN